MSSTVEAFNIGAGFDGVSLSSLFIGLAFACLFSVAAYILIKLFDELKSGKLSVPRFLRISVRIGLLISIFSYFLLFR